MIESGAPAVMQSVAAHCFPGPCQVDSRVRRDHHFLLSSDDCRYLAVYRPGTGQQGINFLMRDYKCHPSVAARNPLLRNRKRRALTRFAAALRDAVPRALAESLTWVPVPTSAIRGDLNYDERLLQTLKLAFAGYDMDMRPLLRLSRAMIADHRAVTRLTIASLERLVHVDSASLRSSSLRTGIALFDDLLTSGKHYRCCERRLHQLAPGIPICGWFLARRALPSRWWRDADDRHGH